MRPDPVCLVSNEKGKSGRSCGEEERALRRTKCTGSTVWDLQPCFEDKTHVCSAILSTYRLKVILWISSNGWMLIVANEDEWGFTVCGIHYTRAQKVLDFRGFHIFD